MSLLETVPKDLLRLILNKVGNFTLFNVCQMNQGIAEFLPNG